MSGLNSRFRRFGPCLGFATEVFRLFVMFWPLNFRSWKQCTNQRAKKQCLIFSLDTLLFSVALQIFSVASWIHAGCRSFASHSVRSTSLPALAFGQKPNSKETRGLTASRGLSRPQRLKAWTTGLRPCPQASPAAARPFGWTRFPVAHPTRSPHVLKISLRCLHGKPREGEPCPACRSTGEGLPSPGVWGRSPLPWEAVGRRGTRGGDSMRPPSGGTFVMCTSTMSNAVCHFDIGQPSNVWQIGPLADRRPRGRPKTGPGGVCVGHQLPYLPADQSEAWRAV